jgi:hypothetical protein
MIPFYKLRPFAEHSQKHEIMGQDKISGCQV